VTFGLATLRPSLLDRCWDGRWTLHWMMTTAFTIPQSVAVPLPTSVSSLFVLCAFSQGDERVAASAWPSC